MKLRKIRSQLLPGVTLCQKDGIGLLAILVEREGRYAVRQAYVPVKVFDQEGAVAATLEREIMRFGTQATHEVAAAWFPEVGDLPYMTYADYMADMEDHDDEGDDAEAA